jgi:ATP-dependent Clp protease ATP-binding subunit ClpC
MTSGFHDGDDLGPSSFDEFLARVYGIAGGSQPPARRLDITTLMNDAAQDLLGAAVGLAAERGSASVDTQHLLWAAARPSRPGRCWPGPGATPPGSPRTSRIPSRRASPAAVRSR